MDLFSADDDCVVGGRNGAIAYYEFGKALALKCRKEIVEDQCGYCSEPTPEVAHLTELNCEHAVHRPGGCMPVGTEGDGSSHNLVRGKCDTPKAPGAEYPR